MLGFPVRLLALQASDLVTLQGSTFDPNEIMTPDVFQDSSSFDANAIQTFLERTPYKQPSFLATYQSNGVRASDGIFRAAQTSHRLGREPADGGKSSISTR